MADVLASLFRFRQFVFEYLPWFLAVWVALAITSGLMTVRTMLAAPIGVFSVSRYCYRPVNGKDAALRLVVAWLVAGSFGVVVDWIQRLLNGG